MSKVRTQPSSRGFTLIELMIVVTIIGIIASVAIPAFTRASLRAKTAERSLLCTAIGGSIQDYVIGKGAVPGGTMTGDWNPALPPATFKRPFVRGMPNWKDLSLVVQGNTFYSYQWVAADAPGVSTIVVQARGDLDGDGIASQKSYQYAKSTGAYYLNGESPPEGADDDKAPAPYPQTF